MRMSLKIKATHLTPTSTRSSANSTAADDMILKSEKEPVPGQASRYLSVLGRVTDGVRG